MFVWCYLRALIGLARMAAAPLDLLRLLTMLGERQQKLPVDAALRNNFV